MSFHDDCADTTEAVGALPEGGDSAALLRAHSQLGPRARQVLLSIAERMARDAASGAVLPAGGLYEAGGYCLPSGRRLDVGSEGESRTIPSRKREGGSAND